MSSSEWNQHHIGVKMGLIPKYLSQIVWMLKDFEKENDGFWLGGHRNWPHTYQGTHSSYILWNMYMR
jgi:hypothetical protein